MGWFDSQIRERISNNKQQLQKAYWNLASVVMKETNETFADTRSTGNQNALTQICRYFHLEVNTVPDNIVDLEEQMEYLFRPSGIMRRRIKLAGEWWKDCYGPILAERKDGQMDNSTKKLLEECSVGCKMGIESMEQVQHHVTDAKIAATIEKSCSKHKELEEEISKILLRAGQPEKEPGVMVSTFSWMTTGVKMMTGEDENKQAVKIIMNGCNMGTQSITEAMHQCKDASSESISIAKKLIGMEENLRDDMQKYL